MRVFRADARLQITVMGLLRGGRWNLVGTPVIYAASSVSLAALEVIAHNGLVPADYRVIHIEIPDDLNLDYADPPLIAGSWPG